MQTQTEIERWLIWMLAKAAYAGFSMAEYDRNRDVILALIHVANGTALSRDFRALEGK